MGIKNPMNVANDSMAKTIMGIVRAIMTSPMILELPPFHNTITTNAQRIVMSDVRVIIVHATTMAKTTIMAIGHDLMASVIIITTTTTMVLAIIIVRIGTMLRLIGTPIIDRMISNKTIIDKVISNKALIARTDIAPAPIMAIDNKVTSKGVHSNVGPTIQMQNIA